MVEDIRLVTKTALARYRATRTRFIFIDRFGEAHVLRLDAWHDKPFVARRADSHVEKRFSTQRDLHTYLQEPAS